MTKVTFAVLYCILVELLAISCLGSNNTSEYTTNIADQVKKSPYHITLLPNQTVNMGIPNIFNLLNSSVIPGNRILQKDNSSFLSILNAILKNFNVKSVVKNGNSTKIYVQKLGDRMLYRLCNPGLIAFSEVLNNLFPKMWDSLLNKIHNNLSPLRFNNLPKYQDFISDKINILELEMKDLVINGMQNLKLVNYRLNLCEMTFEFEFVLPKLDVACAYAARGTIDGKQFDGQGNLSIILDEARVSAKSSMDCDMNKYPKDLCKFIEYVPYPNMNFTVKSAKVNVSGINYNNMTNPQINEAINNFVVQHLVQSSSLRLAQKLVSMAVFKSKLVLDLSPTKLMEKFDAILNLFPQNNLRKSVTDNSMKMCGLFCSQNPENH